MLRLALATLLPVAAAATTIANPYDQQFGRLADVPQRAAMRRAILDSGQRCKVVDRVMRQGQYRNLAYWRGHCVDGQDYAAFIGPDGSVQVRPCADLADLKLPVCRPWPPRRPR